jgi:sigma-B regulation protein RsbU (phosphoserine phosphatase)
MFATVFCAILNIRTGELTFANAGHNPPLLSSSGSKFEFVKVNKALVLGPLPDASFVDQKLMLKPGDSFFLYTDGVTEAMDPDSRQYTDERLIRTISEWKGTDVTDTIRYVMKDVQTFIKEIPQSDDITMLAMKYNG